MSNKSKSAKKKQKNDVVKEETNNELKCSACRRNLSNDTVYIKCAKCYQVYLCLECFSIGMEIKTKENINIHNKDHDYLIIEPLDETIYQKGWTSDEEKLFLHGIQVCGVGNWNDIQELIKNKSAFECEQHYRDVYLNSPLAPYPVNKILPPSKLPPPPDYDTTPRESRPSISHEKNMADRNKKKKTTPAEWAGWMPRRNEFEHEYLNDAENFVANIDFKEDEDPKQFEEKVELLKAYNKILKERHIRIEFAKNWELLDDDNIHLSGETKEEKDIEELLFPIAQVVPRDEFKSFISDLHHENSIKQSINNYQKWRKNGITNKVDGMVFNELERTYDDNQLPFSYIEKWNRELITCADNKEEKEAQIVQMLSINESNLCNNLALKPKEYLKLKDLILREYTIKNSISLDYIKTFFPESEEVVGGVYKFLIDSGFVQ